jgi:hypothetical protein
MQHAEEGREETIPHLDALCGLLEGLVAHKVPLVVVQPELRQHSLQRMTIQ